MRNENFTFHVALNDTSEDGGMWSLKNWENSFVSLFIVKLLKFLSGILLTYLSSLLDHIFLMSSLEKINKADERRNKIEKNWNKQNFFVEIYRKSYTAIFVDAENWLSDKIDDIYISAQLPKNANVLDHIKS